MAKVGLVYDVIGVVVVYGYGRLEYCRLFLEGEDICVDLPVNGVG